MMRGSARGTACAVRSVPSKLLAIAALTTALSSCHGDLTRYYPLDPGFDWQYRVSLKQGPRVVTTTADVTNLSKAEVLGRTAVPQRSEMFGQILVRYLATDGHGVFEFAQQVSDGSLVEQDRNYVLRIPVVGGTTWGSTWQSTQEGRQVPVPTVKTITAVNETVMVPAGTFASCLRLRISGKAEVNLASGPATIEVQGEEWYAPGVGFIKGDFRETINGGNPSTELAMDLQSFGKPL